MRAAVRFADLPDHVSTCAQFRCLLHFFTTEGVENTAKLPDSTACTCKLVRTDNDSNPM